MTRSGRSLLERRLEDVAALDVEARPFEPVAAEARHPLPRARVHPDPSRGWVRRGMPLLLVRKWSFGFALLCSLIALLVQVTTPRIVMATIDRALVARTVGIAPFVWAILGLAVARGVFNYLSRLWLFRFAYELEYDLRVLMYEHLGRQSFSFFDRVQTGQLISRAASDIRAVQMFLTFAPLMLLSAASFLLALVLMVQVHAGLALVALVPLPFVYLTGARMRSLMFPVSWIVQARLAEVATVVEENISGVRVVKSFAAEGRQVGKLSEAAHRLQWATVRQVDVRARYAPFMEALPRLGMAGVLLYGGLLAIDGEVTVGAIVAFSAYVVMLQVPFRLLGFLMMLGQRAAASAERIYEVLDHAPEIVDRPGAVDLLDPRGAVEFRGVRFSYRDVPVLDGLDLRVAPGETLAVVGRTGSGKSTLVRLLARFYDVDDGAVVVDGLDVRDLTLASLRSHVGVVSDDPFLFAASIRDNIAYGRPDASLEEVREAARLAHADEFVEQLPDGYESVVGERGYTLSGGQRQRLALARALLTDPRILVLDDATSSVDVKVEEEIHGSLRRGRAGRTTIVLAHRLSTISLADRVVLLEGGRVVADGTHAGLMATEPRYVEVLARFEEERADPQVGDEADDGSADVAVAR